MTEVLIFNDRFSDNVGDGVIAESLEYGLRTLSPGLGVRTIDLGGRQGYGATGGAGSDWLRRLWRAAPAATRRTIARHRVRQIFRAQVAEAMEGTRAVIIGGGQLITGSSTFFAERLAIVAEEARLRRLPVFLHAIGVSDPRSWKAEASALLELGFAGVARTGGVTVRDADAARHWATAFGGPPPTIARDPALLASQVYAGCIARRREERAAFAPAAAFPGGAGAHPRPRVGLGVIAPAVVDFLRGPGKDAIESSVGYFVALAEALAVAGYDPVLFTNGSGEDHHFLGEVVLALKPHARRGGFRFDVAPRPLCPEDLVACIAGLDVVIAHRLHANIVAHALRIPHLGLDWDGKLRAFHESVGRDQWLVTASRSGPAEMLPLLASALATGIDGSRQANVVGEAWTSIGRLLGRIEPALLPDRSLEHSASG